MYHIDVGETPHKMHDCRYTANVGEELVAEARTLTGTLDEARNVPDFNLCWHDLLGAGSLSEGADLSVVDRHLSHVGVDRAERVVLRLGLLGTRQGIEQGRLADVRVTHDATGGRGREGPVATR